MVALCCACTMFFWDLLGALYVFFVLLYIRSLKFWGGIENAMHAPT